MGLFSQRPNLNFHEWIRMILTIHQAYRLGFCILFIRANPFPVSFSQIQRQAPSLAPHKAEVVSQLSDLQCVCSPNQTTKSAAREHTNIDRPFDCQKCSSIVHHVIVPNVTWFKQRVSLIRVRIDTSFLSFVILLCCVQYRAAAGQWNKNIYWDSKQQMFLMWIIVQFWSANSE